MLPNAIAEQAIGPDECDERLIPDFWAYLDETSVLTDPDPVAEAFCQNFLSAAEEVWAELEESN